MRKCPPRGRAEKSSTVFTVLPSPRVGQPVHVELPGNPLSFQRAAVTDVWGVRLMLMLESSLTLPASMSVLGARVHVGWEETTRRISAQAKVLGLNGRKLSLRTETRFEPQERRRYFRLPYVQSVKLRVLKSWNPELYGRVDDAMGDDLSGNGLRLRTSLALQVGDDVSVQLTLDEKADAVPLQLEGVVRRLLPVTDLRHGVGVQFRPLSRPQEEKLVAYLLARQAERSNH